MAIQITDRTYGCVLCVRAQPGARRNGIVGEQAGALKIAVTAPADKGRANDAIIEILADAVDVKRTQIELVSGPASRQKKFLVRGLTADALRIQLRTSRDV